MDIWLQVESPSPARVRSKRLVSRPTGRLRCAFKGGFFVHAPAQGLNSGRVRGYFCLDSEVVEIMALVAD